MSGLSAPATQRVVRYLRERGGMTCDQIAQQLAVHPVTVFRWNVGYYGCVDRLRVHMLRKMVKKLGGRWESVAQNGTREKPAP